MVGGCSGPDSLCGAGEPKPMGQAKEHRGLRTSSPRFWMPGPQLGGTGRPVHANVHVEAQELGILPSRHRRAPGARLSPGV